MRAAAAQFEHKTRVLMLLLVENPKVQKVAFWVFDSEYDRLQSLGDLDLQEHDTNVSLSEHGMLIAPPPCLLLPSCSVKSSGEEDLHAGASSVRSSQPQP